MPDTREKLIELIKAAPTTDVVYGGCKLNHPAQTVQTIADHLIANGVTVQKWTPASEPPKDHKEYIVMIKGANRPTTLWYRPKQKMWNEVCGDKPYAVTHWMPLPQPPKGE